GQYDAVLLMHHLTLFFGRRKHQALILATGAKYRVGLDNGHGWFLNVKVKDEGFGFMHEAEYNLAVAAAVGGKTSQKELTMPLSEAHRQAARQLVFDATDTEQIARPIIALHPGSGGYSTARRWSPERFAQLANTLYHDVGGQLLLVGGPEEAELHQHIMELLHADVPVRSLAGKGTIQTTAAVLELADLFIGNDAGPMHLATAVGTPTVAIFGLSNSDAWGPYTGQRPDRKAIVVKQALPCMPCFYRGHALGLQEGCATRDCLATLGVEPVAVAARRLLRETGKWPRAEKNLRETV
ncbi:MAG: glycosyltransferase family 9 protein, partial [Ktedonobacteraceae bacterium]